MAVVTNPSIDAKTRGIILHIVEKIKSHGVFDRFRRDCLEELDSKEPYRQLKQRVESHVATFLSKQICSPSLPKNQLRNSLRANITQSEVLSKGVDRLLEEVLNEKSGSFYSEIEGLVHDYLSSIGHYSRIEREKHQKFETSKLTDKEIDDFIKEETSKLLEANAEEKLKEGSSGSKSESLLSSESIEKTVPEEFVGFSSNEEESGMTSEQDSEVAKITSKADIISSSAPSVTEETDGESHSENTMEVKTSINTESSNSDEGKPPVLPKDNKPVLQILDIKPVLQIGTKSDLPKDTKPVFPKDTKPVFPKDTKPVLPKDTKPVLPKDTKPVLPKDTKSVLPKDTKPVLPKDTQPVWAKDSEPELINETGDTNDSVKRSSHPAPNRASQLMSTDDETDEEDPGVTVPKASKPSFLESKTEGIDPQIALSDSDITVSSVHTSDLSSLEDSLSDLEFEEYKEMTKKSMTKSTKKKDCISDCTPSVIPDSNQIKDVATSDADDEAVFTDSDIGKSRSLNAKEFCPISSEQESECSSEVSLAEGQKDAMPQRRSARVASKDKVMIEEREEPQVYIKEQDIYNTHEESRRRDRRKRKEIMEEKKRQLQAERSPMDEQETKITSESNESEDVRHSKRSRRTIRPTRCYSPSENN